MKHAKLIKKTKTVTPISHPPKTISLPKRTFGESRKSRIRIFTPTRALVRVTYKKIASFTFVFKSLFLRSRKNRLWTKTTPHISIKKMLPVLAGISILFDSQYEITTRPYQDLIATARTTWYRHEHLAALKSLQKAFNKEWNSHAAISATHQLKKEPTNRRLGSRARSSTSIGNTPSVKGLRNSVRFYSKSSDFTRTKEKVAAIKRRERIAKRKTRPKKPKKIVKTRKQIWHEAKLLGYEAKKEKKIRDERYAKLMALQAKKRASSQRYWRKPLSEKRPVPVVVKEVKLLSATQKIRLIRKKNVRLSARRRSVLSLLNFKRSPWVHGAKVVSSSGANLNPRAFSVRRRYRNSSVVRRCRLKVKKKFLRAPKQLFAGFFSFKSTQVFKKVITNAASRLRKGIGFIQASKASHKFLLPRNEGKVEYDLPKILGAAWTAHSNKIFIPLVAHFKRIRDFNRFPFQQTSQLKFMKFKSSALRNRRRPRQKRETFAEKDSQADKTNNVLIWAKKSKSVGAHTLKNVSARFGADLRYRRSLGLSNQSAARFAKEVLASADQAEVSKFELSPQTRPQKFSQQIKTNGNRDLKSIRKKKTLKLLTLVKKARGLYAAEKKMVAEPQEWRNVKVVKEIDPLDNAIAIVLQKKKSKKRVSRSWKKRIFRLRRLRVSRKVGDANRASRKIIWPALNPQKRQYRHATWSAGQRLRKWGKHSIAARSFRSELTLEAATKVAHASRNERRLVLLNRKNDLPGYAINYSLKARKWHTPRDVDGRPFKRVELSELEKVRRRSTKDIRFYDKQRLRRLGQTAKTLVERREYKEQAKSQSLRVPKFPDHSWRDLERRTGYPSTLGYISRRRILRNSFITNRWWRPQAPISPVQHPFSLVKFENQPESFQTESERDLYYRDLTFQQTTIWDQRQFGLKSDRKPRYNLLFSLAATNKHATSTQTATQIEKLKTYLRNCVPDVQKITATAGNSQSQLLLNTKLSEILNSRELSTAFDLQYNLNSAKDLQRILINLFIAKLSANDLSQKNIRPEVRALAITENSNEGLEPVSEEKSIQVWNRPEGLDIYTNALNFYQSLNSEAQKLIHQKVVDFKEEIRVIEFISLQKKAVVEAASDFGVMPKLVEFTPGRAVFHDLSDKERGTAYQRWVDTRNIKLKTTRSTNSSFDHALKQIPTIWDLEIELPRFPASGRRKLSYTRAVRVYYRKIRRSRLRRVNAVAYKLLGVGTKENRLSSSARHGLSAARNIQRRNSLQFSRNAYIPKNCRIAAVSGLSESRKHREFADFNVPNLNSAKRRFARTPLVLWKKRQDTKKAQLNPRHRNANATYLLPFLKAGLTKRAQTIAVLEGKSNISKRRLSSAEQMLPRWRQRRQSHQRGLTKTTKSRMQRAKSYNRTNLAAWRRVSSRAVITKRSKRAYVRRYLDGTGENRLLSQGVERKVWAQNAYTRRSRSHLQYAKRISDARLTGGTSYLRTFRLLSEKNERGSRIHRRSRWEYKTKRANNCKSSLPHLRVFQTAKQRWLWNQKRASVIHRRARKLLSTKQQEKSLLQLQFEFKLQGDRGKRKYIQVGERRRRVKKYYTSTALYFDKMDKKKLIARIEYNSKTAHLTNEKTVLRPRKKNGHHRIRVYGNKKIFIATKRLYVKDRKSKIVTYKKPSTSKKRLEIPGNDDVKAADYKISKATRNQRNQSHITQRLLNDVDRPAALVPRTFVEKRADLEVSEADQKSETENQKAIARSGYRFTAQMADSTSKFFPSLISWLRKQQSTWPTRNYDEANTRVRAVYRNLRFFLGQDLTGSRLDRQDNSKKIQRKINKTLVKLAEARFYDNSHRHAARERRQPHWRTTKQNQHKASRGWLRIWFPRLYKFYLEDNDRFEGLTFTVKQAQRTTPSPRAVAEWETRDLFSGETTEFKRRVRADEIKDSSRYENRLRTERRLDYVTAGVYPHAKIHSLTKLNARSTQSNFFSKKFSSHAQQLQPRNLDDLSYARVSILEQHSVSERGEVSLAIARRGYNPIKARLVHRSRLRNITQEDEAFVGASGGHYLRSKSPRTGEYRQRQIEGLTDLETRFRDEKLLNKLQARGYANAPLFSSSRAARFKISSLHNKAASVNSPLAEVRDLVELRRDPSYYTARAVISKQKPLVAEETGSLHRWSGYLDEHNKGNWAQELNDTLSNKRVPVYLQIVESVYEERSILQFRTAPQRLKVNTYTYRERLSRYARIRLAKTWERRFHPRRFKARSTIYKLRINQKYGSFALQPKQAIITDRHTEQKSEKEMRKRPRTRLRMKRSLDLRIIKFLQRKLTGYRAKIAKTVAAHGQLSVNGTMLETRPHTPGANAQLPQSLIVLPAPTESEATTVGGYFSSKHVEPKAIKIFFSSKYAKAVIHARRNILTEIRAEFWEKFTTKFWLKRRLLKNWTKDRKRLLIISNWAERPEVLFKERRTRLRKFEWHESDRHFHRDGRKKAFIVSAAERKRAPWFSALRRRRTSYSTQHGEYRRYSFPREQKSLKARQYYRKARVSPDPKRLYVKHRRWPRLRKTAYRRARSLFELRTTRVAQKHFKKLSKEKAKTTGFSRNIIGLGNRLDVNLRLLGLFKTVFWARQIVGFGLLNINGIIAKDANYRLQPGDLLEFNWGLVQSVQSNFNLIRPHFLRDQYTPAPVVLQNIPANYSWNPVYNRLIYTKFPYPGDIKDDTRLCRWLFDSFRRDAGIGRR